MTAPEKSQLLKRIFVAADNGDLTRCQTLADEFRNILMMEFPAHNGTDIDTRLLSTRDLVDLRFVNYLVATLAEATVHNAPHVSPGQP